MARWCLPTIDRSREKHGPALEARRNPLAPRQRIALVSPQAHAPGFVRGVGRTSAPARFADFDIATKSRLTFKLNPGSDGVPRHAPCGDAAMLTIAQITDLHVTSDKDPV